MKTEVDLYIFILHKNILKMYRKVRRFLQESDEPFIFITSISMMG